MRDDRDHTAIHEAGRAVIGRVLCLECGYLTIEPDEDASAAGHAVTRTPTTSTDGGGPSPEKARALMRRSKHVSGPVSSLTWQVGRPKLCCWGPATAAMAMTGTR